MLLYRNYLTKQDCKFKVNCKKLQIKIRKKFHKSIEQYFSNEKTNIVNEDGPV